MSSAALDKFESIILKLASAETGKRVLKLDVQAQFRPDESDAPSVARNLNAAFLIALSGESHTHYNAARSYLKDNAGHPELGVVAGFYLSGLDAIPDEMERTLKENPALGDAIDKAASVLESASEVDAIETLRGVFFPEGLDICRNWEAKMKKLREARKVGITQLNPSPIRKPEKELLFTSNVLITVPLDPGHIDTLALPSTLRESLKQAAEEEQLHWYDHPIPVGIAPENNEALYGLRGLDEAVAFEKHRGFIAKDARLSCALSVSVTHDGLRGVAKEYLEEEFKKGKGLEHLDVYVFTEADTSRLIDEILIPAAGEYGVEADAAELHDIIGVDGEYGRHYTFLKAISAFWSVLVDDGVRGTFKIDLDQVFPQDRLVAESGASALEHLTTPLWGAEGMDSEGRKVELGMIAGALVNQMDISKSLFHPDVCMPTHEIKADQAVFFSHLPQALSTEAEMMTRYGVEIDGLKECIQRVHVTGGTNGILVESLRRHRPFTPVFIGRAEDQAFIMSVMFDSAEGNLRYVHKDGLIMRHDKEAFASEAMRAASIGKLIGDYTRLLWFSYYARALPWPEKDIKAMLNPFTGCFISHMPFTVVYLRMALKAAAFFDAASEEKTAEGVRFVGMGTKRLSKVMRFLSAEPNPLIDDYRKEKRVWNLYYDLLDRIEKGIKDGDSFALGLRDRAAALAAGCRISSV
jgi:hypothetical protein